jgi:16S rRNA A1518/A1519 N6-dimethyltransferase RsmA/KsgA/DIM1 with predicted DNA glycosylase/AP lyase activity
MKPTIHFSQNFLRSPNLVKKLLEKTNITPQDVVYDIGAGKGVIADVLAFKAHTVIAIEIDPKLTKELRSKFQHYSNVIVFQGDILTFDLPQTPYKIFAGIPYNLSADILHKIVSAKNPPLSSYLIVQQEFAEKVIPSNENNSQLSILLGIQFEAHILHYLRPGDFYPRPRVKSVLLEITKLSQPLILADQQLFRDFVIFTFNSFKPTIFQSLEPVLGGEFIRIAKNLGFATDTTPKQLNLKQWIGLFNHSLKNRQKLEKLVSNYEQEFKALHKKRTKIHRTRL